MGHVAKVLAAAATVNLLLSACASEPRPAADLARAKSLVQQADASNAQRYAATELNAAHDKLQQAEQADQKEKNDVARRRANEAAADAELAAALARSREVQQAVDEQQKDLDMLREEAKRGVP
jgi:ABC-type transporter MlaC component